MNKFDYILYIECKLLFIGFWLCYILRKKKKKKRVYINLGTNLNRYPKKCLLIIVLSVTFY